MTGVVSSILTAEPEPPDAALLRAWEQWLAAERTRGAEGQADQAGDPRPLLDRASEAMRMAVDHIPARTLAGVAVKLRFALCQLDEKGAVRRAVIAGQQIDGATAKAGDWRSSMLVRILENLERMAAG